MSNYNNKMNSTSMLNQTNGVNQTTDNDGFTLVKSKKNYKEPIQSAHSHTAYRNNPLPTNNNWSTNKYNDNYKSTNSYAQNNTRVAHNLSPSNKIQPTSIKKIKKPSYEEQFPSIITHTLIPPHTTNKEQSNINLNFKMAIDVPITTIPVTKTKEINTKIEEKEIFDLSLYVKLQERRQKEYDLIYGEGAFISDRLNYERFESDHESDETESIEDPDADSDNDAVDY